MLAVLQGLVEERPVALPEGLDVSTASLAELAGQLRAARYALVVWAAGELPGPHADLLVGRLAALLRSLNTHTRAAGFPLAGPDNIIGVNQVCAWQTGVPLRTSLASGAPDHDGWGYGAETLLAAGAVDCLLWLTSFRDLEPPGALPTIVLARPGFVPARSVDVLIPVGTPGLDHAGSVYRTDGVVSLPVRSLRDTALPSAAQVLESDSHPASLIASAGTEPACGARGLPNLPPKPKLGQASRRAVPDGVRTVWPRRRHEE